MKRYNQEHYLKREYFVCGHGCGNVTFTTLPRTTEKLTEFQFCSRCGVGIVFCTVETPRKVGSPRSRRQWGVPVQVMQYSTLTKTNYVQESLF